MKVVFQKLFLRFFSSTFGSALFFKVGNLLFSVPGIVFHKRYSSYYQKLLLQGISNKRIIPKQLSRIWPFWVHQQLSPNSESYQEDPLSYLLLNSRDRSWTALSAPGHDPSPITDSRGLLTPYFSAWSLDFWVGLGSKLISPATLTHVKQQLYQHKPMVRTFYKTTDLKVISESFFHAASDKESLLFNRVTLTNISDKKISLSFYLAIRPYNPEGVSPIHSIAYLSSKAFIVNDEIGLLLDQKPDNIVCLKGSDGDVCDHHQRLEMILKSTCPENRASSFAEYRVCIEPGKSLSFSSKIPCHKQAPLSRLLSKVLSFSRQKKLHSKIEGYHSLSYEKALDHFLTHWDSLLKPISFIKVPDSLIQQSFSANTAHLLSFIGKHDIYSGSFSLKFSDPRQTLSMLYTLNRIGGKDHTHSILHSMPLFRRFSLSKDWTLSGPALFTLLDLYSFSPDPDFLRSYIPVIDRFIKHILKHRISSPSHPAYGLMKKSRSLDPNSESEHYFSDSMWALTGLKAAITMMDILQLHEKRSSLEEQANEMTRSLKNYLKNCSFKHLPISHSRSRDSFLISTLSSVFPLNQLVAQDPLITETLSAIDPYLTKGLFSHSGNQSGIQVSENCLLAHTYLLRKDPLAYPLIESITKLASSTFSFSEGIHPISHQGCYGEGHYAPASAAYLLLIRSMLIQEEQQSLLLFPSVPPKWFEEPEISFHQCPTVFGTCGARLIKTSKGFTLTLQSDFHSPPKDIQVLFPSEVDSVTYNGNTIPVNASVLKLPNYIKEASITCNLVSVT